MRRTKFARRNPRLDGNVGRQRSPKPDPDRPQPPPREDNGIPTVFGDWFQELVLPTQTILARIKTPRSGQINDMSVYCAFVTDGPAYIHAYNAADGEYYKDEEDINLEVQFESDKWVHFPVFKFESTDRIIFDITNIPNRLRNETDDDWAARTGSPNLLISDCWVTGIIYSEGGNRGKGVEPKRLAAPGSTV